VSLSAPKSLQLAVLQVLISSQVCQVVQVCQVCTVCQVWQVCQVSQVRSTGVYATYPHFKMRK
jgi:hypothetical protein